MLPSTESWNPAHGQVEQDYLWAMGPGRYQPFTAPLYTPFAIHEQPGRNVVLSGLTGVLAQIEEILISFDYFGDQLEASLSEYEHLTFTR